MVAGMTHTRKLGILGGGQLAQMLALAAVPLGVRCHIYDPSPDAPAQLVATHSVAEYTNALTLAQFAGNVDAITYEFENVPASTATTLAQHKPLYPPARALAIAQDRLSEKQFFGELGFATAPYAAVDATGSVATAIKQTGLPAIAKTRRNGYDGKGQQRITSLTHAYQTIVDMAGHDLIIEGVVPFVRELSILVARDTFGTIVRYPLVENHHHEGILRLSIAPAANVHPHIEALADAIAQRTVTALDYVGVLAIECFEVVTATGPMLLINEMAPRVHNSGHWSIEGSIASQFENHVRAVSGLPLAPAGLRGMCAMLNLIGEIPEVTAVPSGVHVHLYHKAARPGRKVGHLTIVARDMATLMSKIEECRDLPGVWLPPRHDGMPPAKSKRPRA
jgi:5-(carboxyamino)imidazole ribonucleotide synthase